MSNHHSAAEWFETARALGDRARAQAHLLTTKVTGLTHSMTELLREMDGALELTTLVESIMKAAPRTCAPTDRLNRAAQIMWESDCGAVPVVDSSGVLVGIVTDRDICMASFTRGSPFDAISVESTMSSPVSTCAPKDSLGHALRSMAERRVRRLGVTDQGRLVGIVTLADVARHVQSHAGSSMPACLALTHALASISQDCAQKGSSGAVAE